MSNTTTPEIVINVDHKVLFVGSYVVTTVLTLFAQLVIHQYHNAKPTGMQTLHTAVTCFTTKVWCISVTIHNILQCLADFDGPMKTRFVAQTTAILEMYVAQEMMICILYDTLTKYAIISFGPWLASFSEIMVMRWIRGLCFLVPLALIVIEFAYFSSFMDLASFQSKYQDQLTPEARFAVTTTILIFINVFALTVFQIKVEYDALKSNDIQNGCLATLKHILVKPMMTNNQNGDNNSINDILTNKLEQNRKTIRMMLAVGIVILPIMIYQQTGGGVSSRWNLLVMVFLATVVYPSIGIWHHEGMKSIALKYVRTIICFMTE